MKGIPPWIHLSSDDMTQLKKQISPLRQLIIDEMNMRKLSPKTQQSYLRAVERLATYLKHSPQQATSGQLRQFQIALVAQSASSGTINGTLSGFVLQDPWPAIHCEVIMLGAFASQAT